MRDLQQRLNALKLDFSCPVTGVFDHTTKAAVQKFQTSRSIDVDGIVGVNTWSLLVEAGVRLGDRVLYLRTPAMRGDDVADLQQMLSTLGFHTSRIDGIWGPNTSRALVDFQLNTGITGDGVCGALTIVALERVMRPLAGANAVSQLREMHRLPLTEMGSGLAGQRVALGEVGGLGTVMAAVRRILVANGADVLPLNHPDWSAQAVQANRFEAVMYLALEVRQGEPSVNYFQGRHFTSEIGRLLAENLADQLETVIGPLQTLGMALPVLRESQMPAVLLRVDQAGMVLERAQTVAAAVAAATTNLLKSQQKASN